MAAILRALRIRSGVLAANALLLLSFVYSSYGHTPKKEWVDTNIQSSRQAFLDGLTTGLKAPSGKGRRLIIGHIGGEEGFVDESLLMFEAKKGTEDYHKEMNAECFEEWFRGVLPKLKPNFVVVMDNAPLPFPEDRITTYDVVA